MTISRQEFMVRARLDEATLVAWIAEAWLIPRSGVSETQFGEVDVARAELIRDLKEHLDVNDAGIGVILGLIDQVHGLRRALSDLLADMRERSGGTVERSRPEGR
jgi:chaperone modulatory protein CbpM